MIYCIKPKWINIECFALRVAYFGKGKGQLNIKCMRGYGNIYKGKKKKCHKFRKEKSPWRPQVQKQVNANVLFSVWRRRPARVNLPATSATSAVLTFWELGPTLKVTAGPTTLWTQTHILKLCKYTHSEIISLSDQALLFKRCEERSCAH